MADFAQVASGLAERGPHKWEASPRQIRVILGGTTIFNTTETRLVWEHPYYPQYYFPAAKLQHAKLGPGRDAGEGAKGYQIHDIVVDGNSTKDAALSIENGPLAGFLRLQTPKMDSWYEEDEPLIGHPKDPYKRLDTFRSSRSIRVEVNGVEVANAPWSVHLYETGLPVRYYIPVTSIPQHVLRKSSHMTHCPYKGSANYYDVVPSKGAEPVKNIVWYYETSLIPSLTGLACFYNEKVDIWVDGVKEQRPKSKFG